MNYATPSPDTTKRGVRKSLLLTVTLIMGSAAGAIAQDSSSDRSSGISNSQASQTAIITTCLTGDNGSSDNPLNNRFQDDCNVLAGGFFAEPPDLRAFDSLAADQVSAQNAVAGRRNDANLSVVAQRLHLLRLTSNISATDSDTLLAGNFPLDGATGGGASAESQDGLLGVFLNGRYLDGDEDESFFQDGYDFDGWGVLLGSDYRFSDNLVAGAALNYSEGDVDYDDNRGELQTETWGAMGYGSYSLENGAYFEGTAGYSSIAYDMSRTVSYTIDTNTALQNMDSSPDGSVLSFGLGGGYTYNNQSLTVTPSIRFNYLENDVDGYRERSTDLSATGGAMALAVNSTSFDSLTSNLGLTVANAVSFSGGVIIPQVSLEWVREFEDDSTSIQTRYQNDINSTRFSISTRELDDQYWDFSIGLSAQFQGGISGFVIYRTLLEYDGLNYNSVEAGLRVEL
jgi:outer membrane lipase/esterase